MRGEDHGSAAVSGAGNTEAPATGSTKPGFSERLAAEFAAKRHLCVGIDPHDSLLDAWGLAQSAHGAERMGREVVAAAAGVAACVKPQVAFYERFGAAGFAALERVLADARDAGLLVIADAKRGDIGSTFAAYAEAWLSPGSPLEADALTVSPYLGVGALSGASQYMRSAGKGLFVLAATSNPEAALIQQARVRDGRSVARSMLDQAMDLHALTGASGEIHVPKVSPIGVVLGATLDLQEFGIDPAASSAQSAGGILPVLAPGFGVQGARAEDAARIFGSFAAGLLANESRSVLGAGSAGLADRVRERAAVLAEALAGA